MRILGSWECGGGAAKGGERRDPRRWFFKRESAERGTEMLEFLGPFLSDGDRTRGRILRRVILFAWLTWNFYVRLTGRSGTCLILR